MPGQSRLYPVSDVVSSLPREVPSYDWVPSREAAWLRPLLVSSAPHATPHPGGRAEERKRRPRIRRVNGARRYWAGPASANMGFRPTLFLPSDCLDEQDHPTPHCSASLSAGAVSLYETRAQDRRTTPALAAGPDHPSGRLPLHDRREAVRAEDRRGLGTRRLALSDPRRTRGASQGMGLEPVLDGQTATCLLVPGQGSLRQAQRSLRDWGR